MENKNMMGKMLGDDAMEKAAGGAGTRPNPKFELDQLVEIKLPSNGRRKSYGRVTDKDYDESLGEWTYQVEKGYYSANSEVWVCLGADNRYYPESQLMRMSTNTKWQ